MLNLKINFQYQHSNNLKRLLINEFKKTEYQAHERNDLTIKLIVISWIVIDWGRLNCPITW
jgi:hypothetical protein